MERVIRKFFLILGVGSFFFGGISCASIDRAKVGDKEVVVATRMAPVIFTLWGAPVGECIEDLKKEGVQEVTTVIGPPTGGLFVLLRLFSVEACQAVGVK